eukprot:SAG11_NODE_3015_length_2761_cov_12.682945_2_plen_163_part_00
MKLDEWIQLKAEAVARGNIAVYENQHVETLQRKIIHLETMLVEPAAEDADERATENVRPPSVPPIPRVRSLVEAPAAELETEFQENVGIYLGSVVAGQMDFVPPVPRAQAESADDSAPISRSRSQPEINFGFSFDLLSERSRSVEAAAEVSTPDFDDDPWKA